MMDKTKHLMDTFIPYGRQDINQADIDAVLSVLHSDWLTQGPMIERFEHAVANYCGADYAVAVSNATAALHIACLALELSQDDIVWTSPNSYVASANCARYCGAKVDFVDIDLNTYNMSVAALRLKLEHANKNNTLPTVVIPVHFAGQSCEMNEIKKLADQYGFKIIADAAHAIGASYYDQKVGACVNADMTVFSFHPVKVMTTAEGGMVLTNNKSLADKLLRLRTHGVTRNPDLLQNKAEGPWYYEQHELGFNYRMTDLQAALGVSQLARLDGFIASRHQLAEVYDDALKDLPLSLPLQQDDSYSALHLYPVLLRESADISRLELFNAMRAANIGVNVHYIPIYRQPYYQQFNYRVDDFPNMEKYYATTLTLPLYPTLTMDEQAYIIETLRSLLQ